MDFKQHSSVPCQVCQVNVAKYKCPACFTQTCSLECVKSHKMDQECTGIKQKFEPLREMTDGTLQKDLNFLELVYSEADNASRLNTNLYDAFGRTDKTPSLTKHQATLKSVVSRQGWRDVQLVFLSDGMYKRRTNKTVIKFPKVKNDAKDVDDGAEVFWTVEWIIDNQKLLQHKLSEHSTLLQHLSQMIPKDDSTERPAKRGKLEHVSLDVIHQELPTRMGLPKTLLPLPDEPGKPNLDPLASSQIPDSIIRLLSTSNLDQAEFLFKSPYDSKPTYHTLSPSQTLREALSHKTIVEYPTILVNLSPPWPQEISVSILPVASST